MADITDEIKDSTHGFLSRFQHPLFGAFSFTWIIWNWNIPYLLICGRNDYAATIIKIQTEYLISTNQWRLFWWPLIFSAIYVVLGPATKSFYLLVFVKWIESKVGKLEAIPKFELDNLQNQLDNAQRELASVTQDRNSLNGAYYITRKSADAKGEILELQKNFDRVQAENNQMRDKMTLIEGDLVAENSSIFKDKTTAENIRISAENEVLKKNAESSRINSEALIAQYNALNANVDAVRNILVDAQKQWAGINAPNPMNADIRRQWQKMSEIWNRYIPSLLNQINNVK